MRLIEHGHNEYKDSESGEFNKALYEVFHNLA